MLTKLFDQPRSDEPGAANYYGFHDLPFPFTRNISRLPVSARPDMPWVRHNADPLAIRTDRLCRSFRSTAIRPPACDRPAPCSTARDSAPQAVTRQPLAPAEAPGPPGGTA